MHQTDHFSGVESHAENWLVASHQDEISIKPFDKPSATACSGVLPVSPDKSASLI
jgi:hypothetical protein